MMKFRWKLPSPAWPTSGAIERGCLPGRACVSTMHSASREIGTQTSVDPRLAAGPQRQRGVVGVVPRLPQPGAILGRRRPLEVGAAVLGGNLLHRRRAARRRRPRWCRGTRRSSVGFSGVGQLRVAVDRVDLHLVEQLDARHRDAELDRGDHGLAPRLPSTRTAQTAADTASGRPNSRSVTSVMTPSVPSEPTNSRVRS